MWGVIRPGMCISQLFCAGRQDVFGITSLAAEVVEGFILSWGARETQARQTRPESGPDFRPPRPIGRPARIIN